MNFDLEESLAILERTPGTLAALLANAPAAWIRANEGPDTWSAFDIVGHLVCGEETDWIPRARIILESGESRAFDPFDRFAMIEASRGKTLGDLLDAFAAQRARSLATLRGWRLTAADLDRRGTHPAFGSVTMRELLATWVVHDLGHIAQIARVMAKRYAADVGPWVEYLPVLTRR
ncbi:MAG: DinB family protein [bacterium]